MLLADNIPVDHKLECRLKGIYGSGRGSHCYGRGRIENSKKHLQRIALEFGGMVSLSMMQIIFMQRGVLGKGLFDADYAMYLKSENVEIISEEASELLPLIAPLFNTTWEHYRTSESTEFRNKSRKCSCKKRELYFFAHPLSMIYHVMGPKWVKQLLHNAIDVLMPDRLLEHTGPSATIATVNEQTGKNRWIVHLMHYVPERRTEKNMIL